MNAPERAPDWGLTPEAAALVETYFARVHGALLVAAADQCEDAMDDLRAHVLEELILTAGTPADVTRVLAELGPPEALAAGYAEAVDEGDDRRLPPTDPDSGRLHGRILGIPYDIRVPDTDRIANRWWNPLDPRVFVPRVFGLGWDVNFGALAVKLRIVRPDDEDVPFAAVPPTFVAATLALPLLIAVALVWLVVTSWPSLPAQIPSHWNMAGQPDQFWARGAEVAFLALMALVPAALAGWVHVRRRPALNRVAGSAFATFLGTIALSQFVQVLYFVRGDQSQTPTFAGLAAAFLVPFVMLVVLSRMGRAAEQRRDLEGSMKKGRV